MPRDLRRFEQERQDERCQRAWGLRLAGHSYAQIGEVLGCSNAWAWELVARAAAEVKPEPPALKRALEAERLDAALRAVVAVLAGASAAKDWRSMLAAAAQLQNLSESRRKLEGLDVPPSTLDPVDPADAAEEELREWLARAKTPEGNDELRDEAAF